MKAYSNKQYLGVIICGTLFLVSAIVALGFKGLFIDNRFGYQRLYEYQLSKMADMKDVETVFVGDSSLGNAVNADYFSQLSGMQTINLGLTGRYGFAGSYNMIKKARGPNTKNVVLMNSIDMMKRDVSYSGYLMTMTGLVDAQELSADERNKLLGAFFKLVTSPVNIKRILMRYVESGSDAQYIQNDYIRQGDSMGMDIPHVYSAIINDEKVHFLKKIIAYCDKYGLNLILVHGPLHENVALVSQDYLTLVNTYLNEIISAEQHGGVKFIPDVLEIQSTHVGDNIDHVNPEYKDVYTEGYYYLINKYLH